MIRFMVQGMYKGQRDIHLDLGGNNLPLVYVAVKCFTTEVTVNC